MFGYLTRPSWNDGLPQNGTALMLDQLDIFYGQLYRGLVLVPEPREASYDAKDLRG